MVYRPIRRSIVREPKMTSAKLSIDDFNDCSEACFHRSFRFTIPDSTAPGIGGGGEEGPLDMMLANVDEPVCMRLWDWF